MTQQASSLLLKVVLFAACAVLVVFQLLIIVVGLPLGSTGVSDFRQLYTAGYMVRTGHGHELYDYDVTQAVQEKLIPQTKGVLPFNRPAAEALLFVPFSLIEFRQAYFLMALTNAVLLVACAVVLLRYTWPLRRLWKPLPICLFACFLPFGRAIIQGQDSILLALLFSAAAVLVESQYEMLAGLLLGATSYKFQYVLPLIAIYAVWRRWRLVLGFLLAVAALGFLSIAVTGAGSFKEFPEYLLNMSLRLPPLGSAYGIDPKAMPNIRGLFAALVTRHWASQLLTIAASALVLVWCCRQKQSFALAALTAILVSYHCLYHDLSILIVPLVLLLHEGDLLEQQWALVLFVITGLIVPLHVPYWTLAPLMLALLLATGRNRRGDLLAGKVALHERVQPA
jgi:hypothetical protein